MKVLLIVPQRYGFFHSFKETFATFGAEIHSIDYHKFVKRWQTRMHTQIFRFPEKWRLQWESYYFPEVNKHYVEEYNRIKPDIVFIYNNELLLPETLAYFKKKSKIGFFLGDCPYYSYTSRHALPILFYADAIYTYDSFWIEQLKKLGLKNTYYLYPNIPTHHHFPKKLDPEVYNALQSEVLYVGMCYKDIWGIKKAIFLNHFTDFDLQIHGDDSWERWFGQYPALKDHYHPRQGGHITVEHLNDMYNATKIAPVDANPGLLHAVHWRFLEALGSGALPVMEWQQNVVEIFGDADVPAAKTFEEAKEMTRYYLDNESKRVEKVAWMRKIVEEKYSIANNAQLIKHTLPIG